MMHLDISYLCKDKFDSMDQFTNFKFTIHSFTLKDIKIF